jgi:ComF family protein
MIDKMLSFIAPHLCFECRKIGAILCDRCIQNIVNKDIRSCLHCHMPVKSSTCQECLIALPYARMWVVGRRDGSLKAMIDAFKFERTKSVYKTLAQLLDLYLPDLPKDTVIVPIPTIPSHIRARGYDHCALMAREFARRRNLRYTPLLRRRVTSRQLGASKEKRLQQASRAFTIHNKVESNLPYLIIDDVVTTGATLHFAAQKLRDAGAKAVWAAAVTRQALDD